MLLALLISAAIATPPEAAIAEAVADEAARKQLVQSVETALLADDELAYHHAGYLTFWFGRDEWEAAETAYIAMQRSARLYPLIAAFDDALMASPRADIAYTEFRTVQAEDADLRAGVEALEDTGLHWTMDRLDRVIGSTQVGDLDPALRLQDLLGPDREMAIRALATDPSARRRLESWWRYQYETPGASAGRAYTDLVNALRETPGGLAAWRRRETLLANAPDNAAWVRYWHRRVRATKSLGPRYYDYLAALQEDPELADANRRAFQKAVGGRSWPPPGEPPELDAINGSPERPNGDEHRLQPIADRAAKPASPRRPERPTRPVRGGTPSRREFDDRRPEKPARPVRPETGGPNAGGGAL